MGKQPPGAPGLVEAQHTIKVRQNSTLARRPFKTRSFTMTGVSMAGKLSRNADVQRHGNPIHAAGTTSALAAGRL